MKTYGAIGNKIICKLSKEKDTSNGEYVQESGLICAGSDISKKNDFEKFQAEIISVGKEITELSVGDIVQVKQNVGDILEEDETDTSIERLVVYEPKDILAIIK
jgi:co-chaperonin GroES (HSP10)